MILVFGTLADATIALLVTRLMELGCNVRLMDARRHPHDFGAEWQRGDASLDGFVQWNGGRIPFAELTGIYIGQFEAPPWRPYPSHGVASGASASWSEGFRLLGSLATAAPCPVINHHSNFWHNNSKLTQRLKIERCGFRYPRTLLTTSSEHAIRFHDECGGAVIYKSSGHLRTVVRRLGTRELTLLSRCRHCLVMLQEYIPGVEVRVHVVGDATYATRITSSDIDYRVADESTASVVFSPMLLSDDLARRCVNLSHDLGLVVSGLDLRITPDGEVHCLEVNPCPGFGYYEARTGQAIGLAVARLLRDQQGDSKPRVVSGSSTSDPDGRARAPDDVAATVRPCLDLPSDYGGSRAEDKGAAVPLIAERMPSQFSSRPVENPPSGISRTALRQLASGVWGAGRPRPPRPPRSRWNGVMSESIQRAEGVAWAVDEGRSRLLRLRTGTWFTLNDAATAVWLSISGERSVQEILDLFRERHALTADLARGDVTRLIQALQDEDLIERREASS